MPHVIPIIIIIATVAIGLLPPMTPPLLSVPVLSARCYCHHHRHYIANPLLLASPWSNCCGYCHFYWLATTFTTTVGLPPLCARHCNSQRVLIGLSLPTYHHHPLARKASFEKKYNVLKCHITENDFSTLNTRILYWLEYLDYTEHVNAIFLGDLGMGMLHLRSKHNLYPVIRLVFLLVPFCYSSFIRLLFISMLVFIRYLC